MSNLLINIRFGARHFHLTRDWKVQWVYNHHWRVGNRKEDFKWFTIYEFPGLNKFLNE